MSISTLVTFNAVLQHSYLNANECSLFLNILTVSNVNWQTRT